MFRLSKKTSGLTLLDVLLILLIISMLVFGIVYALASYTNLFSFMNGAQVNKLPSQNIFKKVVIPQERHEQIIINLDDKQPFETLSIAKKIMFPFSPEKKIATEWPTGKSGFLVKSYDGVHVEMLGYQYKTVARIDAGSGYKALLDLVDSNSKQIDKDNMNYSYLYVWLDLNHNAQPDQGELSSLKELAITCIDIDSMKVASQTVNNSVITRKGFYTRVDGSKGNILEVDLFQDPLYREFLASTKIPDKLKVIPDIQGMGLVRNLQEAVVKNPKLLNTVIDYYRHDSLSRHYNMLNGLLFEWTRSESIPFMMSLAAQTTERFQLTLADDLMPSKYTDLKSETAKLFNGLMTIEQFTGKQYLYLFTKEILNSETGKVELHLAISFNNHIIGKRVVVAKDDKQQVLISDDMLKFSDDEKIQIKKEHEAIKQNIFDKFQAEKPDLKELVAKSEKDDYQWVDKSLESQIKTGEYFIRERKTVDIPHRRYLAECIKPGNIIDQQVRDCADGKIGKTW